MYLFANAPKVDMTACKPALLQLVAVSGCACECSTLLFTVSVSLHRTVQHYVVLASHSSVLKSFLYIWTKSKEAINSKCCWIVINGQKWWEPFTPSALLWFDIFKASGYLVGRRTSAPATTRLTPHLVVISVESSIKAFNAMCKILCVFADCPCIWFTNKIRRDT